MFIQQFRLFPEHFTKFGQPKLKLFTDTKKSKKNKKSKKDCDCSENQIKVGINFTENHIESNIIGDRIMLSRDRVFDITQIIDDFKRVVKEKEDNDKNNI